MHKSDLLHLFSCFNKEDLRELRKFIRSPYFNRREDVVLLFDHIDQHQQRNRKALDRKIAFAAIYPEEDFEEQKMRYLMSYLLQRLERYLMQKEARENAVLDQLLLARAYRKLGIEKGTRHALRAAKKKQAQSVNRDDHFFDRQYTLEAEQLAFSQHLQRTAPRNYQEVNQALDIAYLSKKLKQASHALAHQAVINVEYDTGLLKLILDYLDQGHWLEEYPAIALYYFYFKTATSPEHHHYFLKLKEGLFQHLSLFTTSEQKELFVLTVNYCIQQFNKGKANYLPEVFQLYQYGLESQLLLEDGQLSQFTFKNIAGIAIRLEAFSWTNHFIQHYKTYVDPKHRENYTCYNLAKLYYAQQQYDLALQRLQQVRYEDLFLNLDAKVLLLKIYFALEELEALDSHIVSFQKFLQRKKLMGYHRENYSNTLHFAQRILHLNPFDKTEKEKLIAEVKQTKVLGEKEWLLHQLTQ